MKQSNKILVCSFLTLFFYLLFTFIFGWKTLQLNLSLTTFSTLFTQSVPFKLLFSLMPAVVIVYTSFDSSLNFESKTVGQGQHGLARFSTLKETEKAFTQVKKGQEGESGVIISYKGGTWSVDTGDNNVSIVSSPGGGKTTAFFLPNIIYNGWVNRNTKGRGASLLFTDAKGELLRFSSDFLTECGYRCFYLDFRNPLQSYRYNLMEIVNEQLRAYIQSDNQNLSAFGKAERYAKTLATSIVDNMETNTSSEASNYFLETSKNLITGLILLVSLYGQEEEKHLISVFHLIIELNGLEDENKGEDGVQKNKMGELLGKIDNDRIINYTGAAIKADVRTTMNIFSSALAKLTNFVDAEFEQMICTHSDEFHPTHFIDKPTAIFLVCPDENTTRHFFASLFIRNMTNQLIELAESDRYNGVLPRKVFCFWDEFGNMPVIKDLNVLFSAARSRGIRFIISLQSNRQLEDKYGEKKAKIVRDSIQMSLYSYIASSTIDTAKEISELLGTKTIMTGSVSKGRHGSTSRQMISRKLMTPDEIIRMPKGEAILIKTGYFPFNIKLPYYEKIYPLKSADKKQFERNTGIKVIAKLDKQGILSQTAGALLTRGMFDEEEEREC